jgi:hypothetical protein
MVFPYVEGSRGRGVSTWCSIDAYTMIDVVLCRGALEVTA